MSHATEKIQIRARRPGDLGWILMSHGEAYQREFEFAPIFEYYVMEILQEVAKRDDQVKNPVWIAECDGVPVGSVLMLEKSNEVTNLHCMFVHPKFRGKRVGHHLLEKCMSWARESGYQKIELRTLGVLDKAKRLYEMNGFQCHGVDPNTSYGCETTSEYWSLDLSGR
jgi:GNAT superfamily N-acetyltransferase